ncbi:MAG: hypothetical protein ACI9EV_002228 [Urechidicola sp.]|jgi:hypothetical protein
MKYDKLNKNWNAEANSPMPVVTPNEDGLSLSFFLNAIIYDHIDEESKGSIAFNTVFKYRLGETNDEGYFDGQFRFKNDLLPWGEFYELSKSKWHLDFPDDEIILNDTIDKKDLRHFIFFFKNQTFECLAYDYKFSYLSSVAEILDEKYPKGYFSHYIAMFTTIFNVPRPNNFKTYIDLYIQMESLDELSGVKEEIKKIKKNQDLDLFLKLANEHEIEGFGKEQLLQMIKVIENYNVQ